MSGNAVYQFDDYRVDPAKRELWCGGKLIPLQPKAFDCLVYLLEHRDRVVGHDEIIATVWGKVEIGDSVLGQIISRIRGVLNDNANKQVTIRTITRVGYSWVMPVRVITAEPEPPHAAEIGDDRRDAHAAFRSDPPASGGGASGAATGRTRRGRATAWTIVLAALAVVLLLGLRTLLVPRPAPATDGTARS